MGMHTHIYRHTDGQTTRYFRTLTIQYVQSMKMTELKKTQCFLPVAYSCFISPDCPYINSFSLLSILSHFFLPLFFSVSRSDIHSNFFSTFIPVKIFTIRGECGYVCYCRNLSLILPSVELT